MSKVVIECTETAFQGLLTSLNVWSSATSAIEVPPRETAQIVSQSEISAAKVIYEKVSFKAPQAKNFKIGGF